MDTTTAPLTITVPTDLRLPDPELLGLTHAYLRRLQSDLERVARRQNGHRGEAERVAHLTDQATKLEAREAALRDQAQAEQWWQ